LKADIEIKKLNNVMTSRAGECVKIFHGDVEDVFDLMIFC
jgi:hypothetical protein